MAGTRQLLPLRSPSSSFSSPTPGRPRWRSGAGAGLALPAGAQGPPSRRWGWRSRAGARACGGSSPAGGGQAGRHGDRRAGGAGSPGLPAPGTGGGRWVCARAPRLRLEPLLPPAQPGPAGLAPAARRSAPLPAALPQRSPAVPQRRPSRGRSRTGPHAGSQASAPA